jgi:hypothetical protein
MKVAAPKPASTNNTTTPKSAAASVAYSIHLGRWGPSG